VFGLASALREIFVVSSGAFPYAYIPGLLIGALTCSFATAVFVHTQDHGLSGWLDEFLFRDWIQHPGGVRAFLFL